VIGKSKSRFGLNRDFKKKLLYIVRVLSRETSDIPGGSELRFKTSAVNTSAY